MDDIKTFEDISLVVDVFYDRVRKDPLLGPVFMERITGSWEPHLQTMRNFWYTVLFAQAAYRGNPFMKHINLPVQAMHFERWIQLFHQTIDELFTGSVADDAKQKAVKMGLLFQSKLNEIRNSRSKPVF